MVLIPLAVVVVGGGILQARGGTAPSPVAEEIDDEPRNVGVPWLAAASVVGAASTILGALAAGRFALLALVWRPILSRIFFWALVVFVALA